MLIIVSYPFIEPYLVAVNEIVIVDEDVPPGFEGTTIAFVADIHCGMWVSPERTRTLVEHVNSLSPDMIILGGDYIDDGSSQITECFKSLSGLSAPLGVYGVLGNHEHWEDVELSKRELTIVGIKLIDNDGLWVDRKGSRIWIGGVGDVYGDIQDTSPIESNTNENDMVIIASHNPDFAHEQDTDLIDLVLSGHTHGGQVSLFGYYAPFQTSKYGNMYMRGLVQAPKTRVYVTTGYGVQALPVRFFARPEIAIIQLEAT